MTVDEKKAKKKAYDKARRMANHEKYRAGQKAYYAANREKWRPRRDKNSYGLDATARQEMYKRQGGKCAICKIACPFTGHEGLQIDHDHQTRMVRGLLCHNCNRGLGGFMDNPKLLKAAIEYLAKVPT